MVVISLKVAGGEVAQQAVEAVHRSAIGRDFAGALGQRRRRGLGRRDDQGPPVGSGDRIVITPHRRQADTNALRFSLHGQILSER